MSFVKFQVEEKSNEITVIPQLFGQVNCSGRVTIDAIGAQQTIVEKLLERRVDYVIALKANQGTLYEQVADFMEKRKETFPVHYSHNKAHGRGEERRVYVADWIGLVDEPEKWGGLNSLVMVERMRFTSKQKVKKGNFSSILAVWNSLLQRGGGSVYKGWGIENRLHWQLDFTFQEDGFRVREGDEPCNLHLVRKWALHLFKKEPTKISVKRKRKKAARDNEFLKTVINA